MHLRFLRAGTLAFALLAGSAAAEAATFSVLHPYAGKDCPKVSGASDAPAAFIKCVGTKAPDGSIYPKRSDVRTYLGKWDRCRNGHYVKNTTKAGQVVVYNHSMYLGYRSLGLLPEGC